MTDQYPQPKLDKLINRLSVLIGAATATLEGDPARVDDWYGEVARQLRRYHIAGFLSGADAKTLSDAAQKAVAEDIRTQLSFLRQFRVEIQDASEWQKGWNARAEMYARSIKVPFNRGITKMLPLPAMPAEGTQCLTNCGCHWEIDWIDEDNSDADAYWRRGKSDSCQTCVERERQWSPVQVRNGVLQL